MVIAVSNVDYKVPLESNFTVALCEVIGRRDINIMMFM